MNSLRNDSYKGGDIWVFIERNNKKIEEVSIELLTPGKKISDKIGCKLVAVIIGYENNTFLEEIKSYGVDEIINIDNIIFKDYSTANYTDVFYKLIEKYNPQGILFGGTFIGKDFAPRLASRCKTGLTAECTDISFNKIEDSIIWTRPGYGGNLMADIICKNKRPQLGTIRQGVFKKPKKTINTNVNIIDENINIDVSLDKVKFLQKIKNNKAEITKIEYSEILVGIGNGVANSANMVDGLDLIYDFAEEIGADIGGSRGAVKSKLISEKYLIGMSGKTVSPKLYIACGISGALQHIVGIGGAKCIVAINNNPKAPIFNYADYGIVGDVYEVLPLLLDELKSCKVKALE
ncbi:electron transfer flavoprotein subunit alpha/FixB family protein [Terrisporobacter vanillatitrophus]|uniref:electron transfer flavoprotein subunit alpha/FixB family protein n=1 Tax=Terrisporobacter vanillatitrophus TaxID=3058402 RepID=UPI003366DEBD